MKTKYIQTKRSCIYSRPFYFIVVLNKNEGMFQATHSFPMHLKITASFLDCEDLPLDNTEIRCRKQRHYSTLLHTTPCLCGGIANSNSHEKSLPYHVSIK